MLAYWSTGKATNPQRPGEYTISPMGFGADFGKRKNLQ
jgi:hypothetical protein